MSATKTYRLLLIGGRREGRTAARLEALERALQAHGCELEVVERSVEEYQAEQERGQLTGIWLEEASQFAQNALQGLPDALPRGLRGLEDLGPPLTPTWGKAQDAERTRQRAREVRQASRRHEALARQQLGRNQRYRAR